MHCGPEYHEDSVMLIYCSELWFPYHGVVDAAYIALIIRSATTIRDIIIDTVIIPIIRGLC